MIQLSAEQKKINRAKHDAMEAHKNKSIDLYLEAHQSEVVRIMEAYNTWRNNKTKADFLHEQKDWYTDIDEPKNERAFYVYGLKVRYPKVSTTIMCKAFDISESTYRQNRILSRDEWDLITNPGQDIRLILKAIILKDDEAIDEMDYKLKGLDTRAIEAILSGDKRHADIDIFSSS